MQIPDETVNAADALLEISCTTSGKRLVGLGLRALPGLSPKPTQRAKRTGL